MSDRLVHKVWLVLPWAGSPKVADSLSIYKEPSMPSPFQFIIITPAGFPDPSLAIAASRAGELGVLDLEYTDDLSVALDALGELAHYGRNDFGIKIGPESEEILAKVISESYERLKTVILASPTPKQLEMIKEFGFIKISFIAIF